MTTSTELRIGNKVRVLESPYDHEDRAAGAEGVVVLVTWALPGSRYGGERMAWVRFSHGNDLNRDRDGWPFPVSSLEILP